MIYNYKYLKNFPKIKVMEGGSITGEFHLLWRITNFLLYLTVGEEGGDVYHHVQPDAGCDRGSPAAHVDHIDPRTGGRGQTTHHCKDRLGKQVRIQCVMNIYKILEGI